MVELLHDAWMADVRIEVLDGRLLARRTGGAVPQHLADRIRHHRAELIAYLAPTCSTCHTGEPYIHPLDGRGPLCRDCTRAAIAARANQEDPAA